MTETTLPNDTVRDEIAKVLAFGLPAETAEQAADALIASRLVDRVRRTGAVAVVDALTEKWRTLPVWGPDERGLHILDGVDHEGLMRDLAALRGDDA